VAWEVNWAHPANSGAAVMARNKTSHLPSGRRWHLVGTGHLRSRGVATPTYRSDSWEVEWGKRNGKLVWARNAASKMPSAAAWHWVDFHTLTRAGIAWKPKSEQSGRSLANGYVRLTRKAMTQADIALAEQAGLFVGARKMCVMEHRLVALKKYGQLPPGVLVRHRNGKKDDNRSENLVLGSTKDNSMDRRRAVVEMFYWRERALRSECKDGQAVSWLEQLLKGR
jgi:hypothetical protein